MSVGATREDEAIGTVTGAYMGGLWGDEADVGLRARRQRASLVGHAVSIPAIMVISERGTMGKFKIGQSLVARTVPPTLDAIGITRHTLTDATTLPFIVDSSIKQA